MPLSRYRKTCFIQHEGSPSAQAACSPFYTSRESVLALGRVILYRSDYQREEM
jgi:hypothetical protein